MELPWSWKICEHLHILEECILALLESAYIFGPFCVLAGPSSLRMTNRAPLFCLKWDETPRKVYSWMERWTCSNLGHYTKIVRTSLGLCSFRLQQHRSFIPGDILCPLSLLAPLHQLFPSRVLWLPNMRVSRMSPKNTILKSPLLNSWFYVRDDARTILTMAISALKKEVPESFGTATHRHTKGPSFGDLTCWCGVIRPWTWMKCTLCWAGIWGFLETDKQASGSGHVFNICVFDMLTFYHAECL